MKRFFLGGLVFLCNTVLADIYPGDTVYTEIIQELYYSAVNNDINMTRDPSITSRNALLPVLVGLFALTLGVSLALSALVVFLSDLTYVWSLFTRMLFFLTPIFYQVDQVDHPIASKVIAWNPLGGLTIAGRDALLYGTEPQGLWLLVGLSFLVFLLGWFVFARLRPAVPDYV